MKNVEVKAVVTSVGLIGIWAVQALADPSPEASVINPRPKPSMRFGETWVDPIVLWYKRRARAVQRRLGPQQNNPADLSCSFKLVRAGAISSINLIKSSGSKDYDDAVIAALKKTAPSEPPPDDSPYETDLLLKVENGCFSVSPIKKESKNNLLKIDQTSKEKFQERSSEAQ